MGTNDTDRILGAIDGLRKEIQTIMVKDGKQDVKIENVEGDVIDVKKSIASCFKKIDTHVGEHVKWIIYTVALVGALVGIGKAF